MKFERLNAAFGARVRAARTTRALTQEQLAEKAGVSRTTINAIETGRQGAGVDVLYALAEAMDLEPPALLPLRSEVGRAAADDASLEAEAKNVDGVSSETMAVLLSALHGTPRKPSRSKK